MDKNIHIEYKSGYHLYVKPYKGYIMLFFIAVFAVIYFPMAWERFMHSQYMQGCTFGRMDNKTLQFCNDAYDRYRAVMANNWKPLPEN